MVTRILGLGIRMIDFLLGVGGDMKLWVPLLCFISLAFAVMLYGEDSDEKGLTGTYLFFEYERLVPLNETIWEGRWVPKGGEYPKTLGMFNSKKVEEIWECGGDLCPQNSAVIAPHGSGS